MSTESSLHFALCMQPFGLPPTPFCPSSSPPPARPAPNCSNTRRSGRCVNTAGDRFCRSRRRCAIAAAIRCPPGGPSASLSRSVPAAGVAAATWIAPVRSADTTARLRAIVHALKYEGRRSLARPLAAMMSARGADMLAGACWVVPVPLHPSRRRERGFNQAADLARHLGAPVRQVLRRHRATGTQTGLPAAQRHRNVRGAFALTGRREGLADSVVVLVDDVSTTGATLDACARVLKEAAGVREVRALTAARVVTPPR